MNSTYYHVSLLLMKAKVLFWFPFLSRLSQYEIKRMWSRNCLPFRGIWVHHRILVGFASWVFWEVFCISLCVLFLLVIVLSVRLRFMDFWLPFLYLHQHQISGIVKLFLRIFPYLSLSFITINQTCCHYICLWLSKDHIRRIASRLSYTAW